MTGAGLIFATATAAKSGSTVTATVNGVVVTVQVGRDLTVASGDVIAVARNGSLWVALARVYAAAPATGTGVPANGVAPNPKPTVVYGTLVVPPVETRSYQSGAWRSWDTSVFQGAYGGTGNRTGAVFYGSLPRSLAGATVFGAGFTVRRMAGGAFAAQATTMRLMTQATRPAGAPTLTSSTAGPNIAVNVTVGSVTLPTAWAQAMVDGTAGGIAFFDADGSPYVQFAGRGDWGPAFTMNINWQR